MSAASVNAIFGNAFRAFDAGFSVRKHRLAPVRDQKVVHVICHYAGLDRVDFAVVPMRSTLQ